MFRRSRGILTAHLMYQCSENYLFELKIGLVLYQHFYIINVTFYCFHRSGTKCHRTFVNRNRQGSRFESRYNFGHIYSPRSNSDLYSFNTSCQHCRQVKSLTCNTLQFFKIEFKYSKYYALQNTFYITKKCLFLNLQKFALPDAVLFMLEITY